MTFGDLDVFAASRRVSPKKAGSFFCCIPVYPVFRHRRDIFILLSMMIFVFLFERRQFLLGLACTYPLMFIKPQNFFMILVPFALTALAGESRGRMIMTVVLGFIFTFAMLLGAGYLGIEYLSGQFYLEDGGMGAGRAVVASPYLAIQLLSSAIGVLLMPMPALAAPSN